MDYAIIAGLVICSVFLFQSARWFWADHSIAAGVVAAVFGVGLLAATALSIAPALFDTEKVQLANRITTLTGEKSKLEAQARESATQQAIAAQKLADAEKKHVARLDTITRDLGDLQGQLTHPASGLIVEGPTQPLPVEREARIETQIRTLAQLRAPQPQPPPTRYAPPEPAPAPAVKPEPDRVLSQLKDAMAARLSTPNYDVEVYPDKELVGGRTGRYYVVDLKNATSGIRYFFAGGKYTLGLNNAEFRTSLNTFIGDILKKFEGRVRYDLFVRGNADGKPYQGGFEPGYEFRSIKYLRSLGNDKYGVATSERVVNAVVRNEDLPDMRAAFMQKVIADAYPLKAPTILQGLVTSKTADKDRNAELIMYVDW